MSLTCVLGVSALHHNIDTQKSTFTVPCRQDGRILRHRTRAQVQAPIQNGTAETRSHPAIEIHVDARAQRVIDKGESEKDRAEVRKTMLGRQVLDSERHHQIVFESAAAEPGGQGQGRLRGNLTLRGQTQLVTVHVMLKDGRYTGDVTVKQTDFGIKPPSGRQSQRRWQFQNCLHIEQ